MCQSSGICSEVPVASYQTIKTWPAEDRPREKLLDKGVKEPEIEMMVKNNAATLLGLEDSAMPRGSSALEEAAV